MPRNHLRQRALTRRSRDARNRLQQYIDLCVQFEIADGEHAGWRTQPYGGRWDRFNSTDDAGNPVGDFISKWDPARGEWVDPQGQPTEPVIPKVIKVAQQSIQAIEDWVHSVMLILGGRRSGKTTGTLSPKILVLLIVFSGLPGCVLSPTYRQSMNVWRALVKLTPRAWWAEKNKSERRLRLINGAEVVLLSADRDDSSRSEGCVWQVNDERQDIGDEPASNAMLSASEASGPGAHIVIETATIKPELRDHFDKVTASAKGAVYYMDSFGNPFIDHGFLRDAMEFLDDERIAREIYGRWPELKGRCYFTYDDAVHVADRVPGADITADICREKFDIAAQNIVSVDPAHHAVVWRIHEGEVAHVRHEIVVGADGKDGDIRTLAKMARAACGAGPAVAIIDPHETHYDDDARKYLRSEGFRIAFMKRVEIEYRLTAVRARFEKSKLYVASSCIHLREALRDQVIDEKTHRPSKQQKSRITPIYTLDHIVDALGYGIYKFWAARVDYEKLEQLAA